MIEYDKQGFSGFFRPREGGLGWRVGASHDIVGASTPHPIPPPRRGQMGFVSSLHRSSFTNRGGFRQE